MLKNAFFRIKDWFYWLAARENLKTVKITARGSVVYKTNCKKIRRRIWIYVPADYDASNSGNRTVYMLDGQNMFDIGTGAYGTWNLESELDSCRDRRTVIVGIQHGIERENDYSLAHNADATIEGIAGYVIPLAETLVTGSQSPAQRIIGGSSLGANAAIAALPGSDFSAALLFSTAVEVDYAKHLDYVRDIKQSAMRVYMDIGTKEASCQGITDTTDYGMIARCAEIKDILEKACGEQNVILYIDHENCYHCEQAWGTRFPAALEWAIQKQLCQ